MTARDWLPVMGDGACDRGEHDWQADGGRACPRFNDSDEAAAPKCSQDYPSQPVFRCRRCPAIDYGEKGGPGWLHCEECERRAT